MARFLITGATGQVGSFVVEEGLRAGHVLSGTRGPRARPLPAGVLDAGAVSPDDACEAVRRAAEAMGGLDAVIHLAARSRAGASFNTPAATFAHNANLGVALVEAATDAGARFVHASSAEIFAGTEARLLTEDAALCPRSPYGVAKAAVHLYVQAAREGRGATTTNVILFNAESERRPAEFVVSKIVRGLAAVKLGHEQALHLGNTAAVRDFGHAADAARALWIAATRAPASDYVCATGEGHSVLELATLACVHLGLDPARVLRTEPSLLRPHDAPRLVGDASRLRALGWAPRWRFDALVRSLVDHHLRALSTDGASKGRP